MLLAAYGARQYAIESNGSVVPVSDVGLTNQASLPPWVVLNDSEVASSSSPAMIAVKSTPPAIALHQASSAGTAGFQ